MVASSILSGWQTDGKRMPFVWVFGGDAHWIQGFLAPQSALEQV
jgi:hypothetical protein